LPLILDAHSKRAIEVLSRIGNFLSNLAPNNSVLRRVSHLELASRNLRGGDNFKIGEWHEIPDFQLTLAHNCQGRRLHSANPDHPARTSAQDDGRSAGE
jgi:hypothetical protein